jgi:hypothetical protein
VLRHLLDKRTCDLRALDLEGFRRWLDHHLARWQRDAVFVQRTRIREMRRAHPRLRELEAERRRAATVDEASPQFERLRQLEQELIDAGKAISGLSAALDDPAPEKRSALQEKRDAFVSRRATLLQEQAELVRSSGARQALERITAELEELRSASGLAQEEARLKALLSERGRRSGRSGADFEDIALEVTRRCIVPDMLRKEDNPAETRPLRVLRGVTLGAARTEFDQLVVRCGPGPGEPVEVLALVEIKRNLDDLAHGFSRRQENLAWLSGDRARYDSALYRTQTFPTGHFDREAVHRAEDESFVLGPHSFRHFRADPATDSFLDRFYLLTRRGTIQGVSGAALARIAHRVATDEHWDPADDVYLRRLLTWCRSLAAPLETPEVLSVFTSSEERARQILVVAR